MALLLNAARVQVFQADALDANPANRRLAIARYHQPRGAIVVGEESVTGSKDTGQQLRYERTYKNGPLYASVTGYASQTYGTTLVENAEDPVLAGTSPLLSVFPLWNDLTGSRHSGGRAVTTIKASMQQAAFKGLAGKKGAVAALEPATGRILALVSSPSYEPGVLSGTGRTVTDAWRRLTSDPDQPMLNRAIRGTYPPGSAFKIVTAAAALDAGAVTDVDAPTDTPDPYVAAQHRHHPAQRGERLRQRLARVRRQRLLQHGDGGARREGGSGQDGGGGGEVRLQRHGDQASPRVSPSPTSTPG